MCNISCKVCFSEGCGDANNNKWIKCETCNRNFKNPVCFANHKSRHIGNKTVCQLYYRCKTCNAYISVAMSVKQGKHSCIKKYCNTCKEMVGFEHQCYIKVIDRKKPRNSHTETLYVPAVSQQHMFMRDEMDDTDERAQALNSSKRKKSKTPLRYIFFDFECTQVGGTHVPNLCVADVVCELCAGQPAGYNANIVFL